MRSHLAAPHVESFNYFINEGLPQAVKNLLPITIERPNEEGGAQRLTMSISSVRMSSPIKSEDCKDPRMLPSECRHLRLVSPSPAARLRADAGAAYTRHVCRVVCMRHRRRRVRFRARVLARERCGCAGGRDTAPGRACAALRAAASAGAACVWRFGQG